MNRIISVPPHIEGVIVPVFSGIQTAGILTKIGKSLFFIYRTTHRCATVPYENDIYGVEINLPDESGLAYAMAKLPARYREVLQLRFGLGLSTKEIGKLFDMRQDSVQKLVWRAKQALQTQLEKDGEVIG